MGSVKDLDVLKTPTKKELGDGVFYFSDRYSVFDWGEMPDLIPGKGEALNMMSAHNFIELEKRGIKSHFQSLYLTGSEIFNDSLPSSLMKVKITQVIPIENDYKNYDGSQYHYLIPLEIIYRNGLPKGSSIFKKIERAKDDKNKLQSILASIGLKEIPKPGMMLPRPVYDFTTKLEPSDRALSEEEAKRISGLSDTEFSKLTELASKVNDFITEKCDAIGFKHFDGKIEAMKLGDEIILVDVLGTFDENRFLYMDEQISKEILRQAYIKLQPEFVAAVEEAKDEAERQNTKEWKNFCKIEPKPLPKRFVELVSLMYKSGANKYIGKTIFPDIPKLEELIPQLIDAKTELSTI